LLEPRWLVAGMNELGFDINTATRKEPPLAFDAALYGLTLTFTGAAAAAEQIDVTDPPEFWEASAGMDSQVSAQRLQVQPRSGVI
jgi:hypothetical protein